MRICKTCYVSINREAAVRLTLLGWWFGAATQLDKICCSCHTLRWDTLWSAPVSAELRLRLLTQYKGDGKQG